MVTLGRTLFNRFTKPAGLLGAYVAWHWAFKLLTLTLLTYFLMAPTFRLQDLSETYSAIEITVSGFSVALFLFFLSKAFPLGPPIADVLWNQNEWREGLVPNLAKGVALALAITSVTIVFGRYEYLGFLLHSEDTFVVMLGVCVRAIALFLLVVCEEYLFRERVLPELRKGMPLLGAAILTSLAYTAFKAFQFRISGAEAVTFFLLSYVLCLRRVLTPRFVDGAGHFAGFLITLNAILGLPLFQSAFTGLFLIKTRGGADEFQTSLTGGDVGPLAGVSVQAILILEALRLSLKTRKILLR